MVNTRVSFDGKFWYLSYSHEIEETISNGTEEIGVDLGIKDLAIISDGRIYRNINKTQVIRKLEKQQRRLQRQISRKYEMNKQGQKFVKTDNIKKLEQRLRLINRRLANIRNTYIHEVTKDLVRTTPKKIVIEDLNVKGMMKNKHLSKAVSNQCFNKFRKYLIYKCQMNGIEFVIPHRGIIPKGRCSLGTLLKCE